MIWTKRGWSMVLILSAWASSWPGSVGSPALPSAQAANIRHASSTAGHQKARRLTRAALMVLRQASHRDIVRTQLRAAVVTGAIVFLVFLARLALVVGLFFRRHLQLEHGFGT